AVAQRGDAAVDLLVGSVPVAPRTLPAAAIGFAALGVAFRLLRGEISAADVETVLRGAPNNVTTEMDLQLWDLAVVVRADPASFRVLTDLDADELAGRYRNGTLPAALQRGMAGFLDRYGQRAVAEIDLGTPRWSQNPSHLFGVLAGYLRLAPDAVSPDRRFAAGPGVGRVAGDAEVPADHRHGPGAGGAGRHR